MWTDENGGVQQNSEGVSYYGGCSARAVPAAPRAARGGLRAQGARCFCAGTGGERAGRALLSPGSAGLARRRCPSTPQQWDERLSASLAVERWRRCSP